MKYADSHESVSVFLTNETNTVRVAERIAALLRGGDLLLLRGDLGAGKTTFTRGLVSALGSTAAVSSPTFTLVHEYAGGRLPVVHVDAYRLRSAADAESIGLVDCLNDTDAVLVIEWPERIELALPPDRLELRLEEVADVDCRHLTVTTRGQSWNKRAESLATALAEFAPC